jgi:hypothetical protein
MADYVLLYTGGSMPETEDEQARVMQAWDAWFHDIGSALKDGGNPFTAAVRTVGSDGAVGDGSTGPLHTGYTIVTADSLDDATAIAKGSPVLQGGASITVYETLPVM